MHLRRQVTPKTNTLPSPPDSSPECHKVQWWPGVQLCYSWHSAAHGSPSQPWHLCKALPPLCLQRYHQCPQKQGVWQLCRQHPCFSPWSKQLQTEDFRESESLASTYAVLWEPLIIQQIFLEPFVNELWLHSCGVWWQLCQKQPLVPCATAGLDLALPRYRHLPSDLEVLGGTCLNPPTCSAACAFPSVSGEQDREDGPQEVLQTPSGCACKLLAS